MPNCAAAPKIISFGFVSSGPKSIIAPMPMNKISGNSSFAMPASYKNAQQRRALPCPLTHWSTAPDIGRFTKIAPNPIGRSRLGSISFAMAR